MKTKWCELALWTGLLLPGFVISAKAESWLPEDSQDAQAFVMELPWEQGSGYFLEEALVPAMSEAASSFSQAEAKESSVLRNPSTPKKLRVEKIGIKKLLGKGCCRTCGKKNKIRKIIYKKIGRKAEKRP